MIKFFITNIIITISLSNYLLLFYILLTDVMVPSNNIFKYKIYHLYLTIVIAILYFSTFFVFIYIWRIYNVYYELNVKHLLDNMHRLWLINISHLPFSYQIYIICIILLFICYLLLFFIKIHKKSISSMYKLYIYYHFGEPKLSEKYKWINMLSFIGQQDIITYFIGSLLFRLMSKSSKILFENNKLPWYHYYAIVSFIIYKNFHKVQLILTISPLLIILHDIIFNNYIITTLYPYLILYFPIITVRRFTTFLATNADHLSFFLHKMYYKQEKNVLYALNVKNKAILDTFLVSDLQSNINSLDLQYYLVSIIRFELKEIERNVWSNSEGYNLRLVNTNQLFQEIEEVVDLYDLSTAEGFDAYMNNKDENNAPYKIIYKLGEEWILLQKC